MLITLEKILLEYDPEAKNLLPALEKISAVFGYVSRENARKVADYFSLPESKVYETASFYDLVNIKKQPNLIIKVCSGTHCAVSDSRKIVEEIENKLHIKAGDENNPRVKLEIISCLGRCGEGPVAVINDKVYERVTAGGVGEILEEWI
ncbi:MAG: NAD(P)H-dependent oxidoreductase subunit E [Candidatus Pacebacteria bacterium]|nr:NAD(P)H-dependent oxidoreductase subunit E [Candidatus Paceibacterota bacterium]MDR3583575.1 NAD(P)H-dependent oxidoreductase subunit E [Candidatus Paceibacterota bacterium]